MLVRADGLRSTARFNTQLIALRKLFCFVCRRRTHNNVPSDTQTLTLDNYEVRCSCLCINQFSPPWEEQT